MTAVYRPPPTEERIREAFAEGRVWDTEQAAEWLRVDPITVRTLVAKKKLRTLQPGRRPLLFLEDDVHDCADAHAPRSRKTTRLSFGA